MDKVVDNVVGLGISGLAFSLAIGGVSGGVGATITTALVILASPFGMLGGIAVLGILSAISEE